MLACEEWSMASTHHCGVVSLSTSGSITLRGANPVIKSALSLPPLSYLIENRVNNFMTGDRLARVTQVCMPSPSRSRRMFLPPLHSKVLKTYEKRVPSVHFVVEIN
jgi:hypothetical protein